jgi:hypothetical protein
VLPLGRHELPEHTFATLRRQGGTRKAASEQGRSGRSCLPISRNRARCRLMLRILVKYAPTPSRSFEREPAGPDESYLPLFDRPLPAELEKASGLAALLTACSQEAVRRTSLGREDSCWAARLPSLRDREVASKERAEEVDVNDAVGGSDSSRKGAPISPSRKHLTRRRRARHLGGDVLHLPIKSRASCSRVIDLLRRGLTAPRRARQLGEPDAMVPPPAMGPSTASAAALGGTLALVTSAPSCGSGHRVVAI